MNGKTFSTYLDGSIRADIEAVCAHEGVNASALLRVIVRDWRGSAGAMQRVATAHAKQKAKATIAGKT